MALVRVLILAIAALALAGCGKTACDKAADGYYAYRSAGLGCAYTLSPIKIGDACSVRNEKCTADDDKLLEAYGDCLSKVAKCEVGKEQDFADGETACYAEMSKLSDGCAAGLSLVCTTSTNQAYSLLDAFDAVEASAAGCTTPPAFTRKFVSGDTCMAGIMSCTNADLAQLATYANCLAGIAGCEDGKEQEFVDAVGACDSALTVSSACAEGLKPAAE